MPYILSTNFHVRSVIRNFQVEYNLQSIVSLTVTQFRNGNAVACSTKALPDITDILNTITMKNKHLHVMFAAKCVLQDLHIIAISTDTEKRISLRARFVISVSLQRKVGETITLLFMKDRSSFVIFVVKKRTVNRAW